MNNWFDLFWMYLKNKRRVKFNATRKKIIKESSKDEIAKLDGELYFERMGKQLDWNNLQTWTEKMQWEKIYDDNPLKTICADKYLVRTWVKERIGEEYLIPLLGCWDKYNQIDLNQLPDGFVLKSNHGSGDVVVVKDKNSLSMYDKLKMRIILKTSEKIDFGAHTYELHYSGINKKFLAEEIIGNGIDGLLDYKFFCFDGIPYFCAVFSDRESELKSNVYDMNWNFQSWNTGGYKPISKEIKKPDNFELMIELAKKLSSGFSHVRVDFYNVDGKIYFGEMTFTGASGLTKFSSDEADRMLGNLWKIQTLV